MRTKLGLALVLLLGACGDEGQSLHSGAIPAPPLNWGPASTPQFPVDEELGPLGGWFFCKNVSCAQLDDSGLVFKADLTWRTINAPGSTFDPGESYCEEWQGGTYAWDGSRLELVISGDDQGYRLSIEVVSGTAKVVIAGKTESILKRVTASSTGRCIEALPTP